MEDGSSGNLKDKNKIMWMLMDIYKFDLNEMATLFEGNYKIEEWALSEAGRLNRRIE